MADPNFDQRSNLPLTANEEGRNDVIGLRALLFNQMRTLPARATKEQLETAKVMCELSQTIINSVKAETLFIQANVQAKKAGSGFFPEKLISPDETK